jgi:hypothetical protein
LCSARLYKQKEPIKIRFRIQDCQKQIESPTLVFKDGEKEFEFVTNCPAHKPVDLIKISDLAIELFSFHILQEVECQVIQHANSFSTQDYQLKEGLEKKGQIIFIFSRN